MKANSKVEKNENMCVSMLYIPQTAAGFYLWYILSYSMTHTLQVLCSLVNDRVQGMVL